jgi:Methylamine utilisation protein MauE
MGGAALAVASVILAAAFAWAGLMKILQAERWLSDLRNYRLPRPVRALGFLVLPWLEICVAALLIASAARVGALIALTLLVLFCLAILRARALSGNDRMGCGCFGSSTLRDFRVLLLRNAALGALAAVVLASGRDRALGRSFPSDGSGALLALLTAAGGLAAAWILWQVAARIRRNQV